MRKKIILTWLALFTAFLQITSVHAENAADEFRTWTSKAGTSIEARLIKQSGQTITLEKKADGKKLTLKLRQLSKADQEFISSIPAKAEKPENEEPKGETTIAGIDASPGQTSAEIHCISDEKWSYFIYLPKQFHAGKKWPVWFIMSAGGGKGGGALNRYKAGADRLGCILALSVPSKNSFWESDIAIETMVKDVYQRLPVIDSLGFTTGMSGGSRMAYLLAERSKHIAGVLACGSGSGVYLAEKEFRSAKLRRTTYVYSLIGTNCFNRAEATTSHNKFPKNYRLRFFPGKHAWAGSPYIEEGMARVLGEALNRNKDRDLEKLKSDYAATMWTWTKELETNQPWEAAYWAEFLAEFKANSTVQRDAEKLYSQLKSNPKVELAHNADLAIEKFRNKYYNRFMDQKAGKQPAPAREAKANKIAEEFEGLPHAKIIQMLGKPT